MPAVRSTWANGSCRPFSGIQSRRPNVRGRLLQTSEQLSLHFGDRLLSSDVEAAWSDRHGRKAVGPISAHTGRKRSGCFAAIDGEKQTCVDTRLWPAYDPKETYGTYHFRIGDGYGPLVSFPEDLVRDRFQPCPIEENRESLNRGIARSAAPSKEYNIRLSPSPYW
jgi:hypothetical protein